MAVSTKFALVFLAGWAFFLAGILAIKPTRQEAEENMSRFMSVLRQEQLSAGSSRFNDERFCASSSEHRTPSGSQLTADKKEQPFRGTRSLRLVDLAKTVGRVPAESSTGNTCSARASSSLGPACVYHAPVNMMMTAANDYGFYAVPKNLGRPRILKPYYISIFKRLTASKISF